MASWDPEQQTNRKYPWGDEFDPAKCNTWAGGPRKTTAVGAYPDGASAYGCHDMAGNVWEWTASRYSEERDWQVLRGGSWGDGRGDAASDYRNGGRPFTRDLGVGFCCART